MPNHPLSPTHSARRTTKRRFDASVSFISMSPLATYLCRYPQRLMDGNRCCFDRPELRAASERSMHCVIARDRLRSTAARNTRPTALPGQRHAAAATQHRAPLAVRVTASVPIWISGTAAPAVTHATACAARGCRLRAPHRRPDTKRDRFAASTPITDLAPHVHASKDHTKRTRSIARDAQRTTINPLSCFATLRPRLSPNATLADRPRCAACVATTRPIARYALRGNASAAMACDLRDWLRTGPGSPPLPARP